MSKSIKDVLYGITLKEVKGSFRCDHKKLTSLEGCPEIVGETFDCNYNYLTSLEHCPKTVGERFWCCLNKKKFTKEEVKKLCDVKGKIFV